MKIYIIEAIVKMAKTDNNEKLSIVMKSTNGLNIKFTLVGQEATDFKKLVASLISPDVGSSEPITSFE